jgi:hypothetical protein
MPFLSENFYFSSNGDLWRLTRDLMSYGCLSGMTDLSSVARVDTESRIS